MGKERWRGQRPHSPLPSRPLIHSVQNLSSSPSIIFSHFTCLMFTPTSFCCGLSSTWQYPQRNAPFKTCYLILYVLAFCVVWRAGEGPLDGGRLAKGQLWCVHRRSGRISSITSLASCSSSSSSWWCHARRSASSWYTSSCVQR